MIFRRPFMRNHPERLVFLDETWLKTNMIKTTGWAPVGERLVDHAPFGHWRENPARHRFEGGFERRRSSPHCAMTVWTHHG